MRFKGVLVVIIAVFFCISLANAIPRDSEQFYGVITYANIGDVLVAYINSVASGNITLTSTWQYGCYSTTEGVLTTCSDGSLIPTLSVEGRSGDSITFKVGTETCGTGTLSVGAITMKNLSCDAGTTTGGGLPGTAGGGGTPGAGAAAAPTAAPTETLTDVTNPQVISDIKQSLPEGWDDIKVEMVDTTTTKSTTASVAIVDNALSYATDPVAISELQNLKNAIASGDIGGVGVTSTATVYKVTNKDTGEIEYRTQIHLIFTAPYDMEDIKIIETVPKSMANSVDDLVFIGQKPTKVLQKDPIVEWDFPSISQGQTKDLSYIVKDKVEAKSITTATGKKVGEAAPPEEKPKVVTAQVVIGITIMVLIVLIGLLIYYSVTKKKREG